MSMVVWKYSLNFSAWTYNLPKDAAILSIQKQAHDVCLWALVNPKAPYEPRRFEIIGTGQEVPQPSIHRGTVQDGSYVWHVFELLDLTDGNQPATQSSGVNRGSEAP